MGAHTPRRSITPLNRRGIGRGISQLVKHLLNAALRAMGVADVHGHDALAVMLEVSRSPVRSIHLPRSTV